MQTGAPVTPSYSLVNGIASPTGTPAEGARMQVINPDAPVTQRFGPPPERGQPGQCAVGHRDEYAAVR